MFICPFVFVEECGEGLNPITHYIYAVYTVLSLFFELHAACTIQSALNNKSLLKFNKWHFCELLMG